MCSPHHLRLKNKTQYSELCYQWEQKSEGTTQCCASLFVMQVFLCFTIAHKHN